MDNNHKNHEDHRLIFMHRVSNSLMGRKKVAVKKIENSTARQVTYSKRKDGMIKKANELAILCDIDIALVMFSPSGRLTTFSSRTRVEDIFLRFLSRPDELKGGSSAAAHEPLIQKLMKLKIETEMLEKIAQIEELEGKVAELNKRKQAAYEKMRYYQPEVWKIKSSIEADVHLQFLEGALHRIQLARAKLLGKQVFLKRPGSSNSEVAAFSVVGESSAANEYARGMGIPEGELSMEVYQPTGPHLSLDYIMTAPNQWYNSSGQRIPTIPGYL